MSIKKKVYSSLSIFMALVLILIVLVFNISSDLHDKLTESISVQLQEYSERVNDTDVDHVVLLMDNELRTVSDITKRNIKEMRIVLLGGFIFVAMIFGTLVYLELRKVFRRMDEAASVMNNVAIGTADSIEKMKIEDDDELTAVAAAYNRLADTLDRHIRYERAYKKEIEEQNWLKTMLADLTTMYQGIEDVDTLAIRLMSRLVPATGSGYGAFYLAEERGEHTTLHRLASYGGAGDHTEGIRFGLGEGLVGQCALERKMITLDVPQHPIRIRTASIEAVPAQIIIAPVEFDDQVLAVVELATLASYTPLHRALLQQVTDSLNVVIRRVLDNMRVKQLLSDSQALTEELQMQSEELQEQQEELISINEKMQDQYRSAELRSLELQAIRAELEDKARQLEQSSQYKSQFLANMSHELRTPLNSLLILAKILRDNEDGRLSPKQAEYAAAIFSSGQQLLLLINDILDLSKVESGKVDIYVESVRIDELAGRIEQMFIPVAGQKGIAFSIEIAPDTPDVIYTDYQRLQQILNNLLSNAFKFTEQGQVVLRMEGYGGDPSGDEDFNWIALSVEDTGIGIQPDKLSIIFETFQQADGTTSRKYGGSGLGLSISRNMATLLGGSIGVRSEVGQGSCFTVYLPIGAATEQHAMYVEAAVATDQALLAASEEEHADSGLPEGRTILLIDPDIREAFSLAAMLETCGLNVILADNGHEALAKARVSSGVDLVLTDIGISERTDEGWQQAIAAPVLVLEKPVQWDDVLPRLREWLTKSRSG